MKDKGDNRNKTNGKIIKTVKKDVKETGRMLSLAANGKKTVSLILPQKKLRSLVEPKAVNRMKDKDRTFLEKPIFNVMREENVKLKKLEVKVKTNGNKIRMQVNNGNMVSSGNKVSSRNKVSSGKLAKKNVKTNGRDLKKFVEMRT